MGNRKHLRLEANHATFTLPDLTNAIQAERDRCASLARKVYDNTSAQGLLLGMAVALDIETLIREQT